MKEVLVVILLLSLVVGESELVELNTVVMPQPRANGLSYTKDIDWRTSMPPMMIRMVRLCERYGGQLAMRTGDRREVCVF